MGDNNQSTTTAAEALKNKRGRSADEADQEMSQDGGGGGVRNQQHSTTPPSSFSLKEDENLNGNLYSFVVAGSKFTVHKRYQLIKAIGHGAYGVVVSANDLLTGGQVAIKKVPHAFSDLVDAKRILREIKLLMHFKHDNMIMMKDIIYPACSIEQYEDVYLVTDLMETDLHRIIYSRQPLMDDHLQYFVYQLLCALKYMHSAGVLHRDLKPSNLLLNSNCDLKVCDFGLARGVNDAEVDLTEYVVTRWYRAPEIMLSCKKYTFAIDVWSVGCILAELLGRKPIFPGDDYIHQLQIINEVLGSPSLNDMSFVTSEKAKRFMLGLPRKEPVPFESMYPNANPLAIDLLRRMLIFDPSQRISVDEALRHPYLESIATPDDEIVCPEPFVFEYEGIKLDRVMLQELLWQQMMTFHEEARVEFQNRKNQGLLKIDVNYKR